MDPYLELAASCDVVFASQYQHHVGRGEYLEVAQALEHGQPCWAIGELSGDLARVTKVQVTDESDWAGNYAALVTEPYVNSMDGLATIHADWQAHEADLEQVLADPAPAHKHVAVTDIETTGFTPGRDFIVEVGVALLDLADGSIKEMVNSPVKERGRSYAQFPKTAWVFAHSDLTPDAVLEAPMLDEFDLARIYAQHPFGGFNIDFDAGFLKKAGVSIPKLFWDPMHVLTPQMKLHHSYYGAKFPKFPEAWAYLFPGRDYTEAHRAYDDAAHEAELIYAMIERGLGPQEGGR
jgi:hypothetical protein